ncbi:MAG: hypothetical protein JWQ42_2629 [Edaphobacter sp.]|nr:hypothetical protein [Edaphobacter sp.]
MDLVFLKKIELNWLPSLLRVALQRTVELPQLLGKPFGTFQDYAVLFLWAAGTKIGVDIVTAVTDKFVSAASSAPHA